MARSRFTPHARSYGVLVPPAVGVALALVACGDTPTRNALRPTGVIEGAFAYEGPLPCTQGGTVVGNAVLLLFDLRALPPPDGLGVRASRIVVVPGETLFASEKARLPSNANGSRACPDPSSPANRVSVTSPFEFGGVEVGVYQLRAFYDLDGDFHPSFRYSNLPTLGDVAGGALTNAAAAAAGARPVYREIVVGQPDGKGAIVMPPEGSRISGISVVAGRTLPFQRPFLHVERATLPPGATEGDAREDEAPTRVRVPADFLVRSAAVTDLQANLVALRLTTGVRADETDAARGAPFFLPIDSPGALLSYWVDSNRDGKVDDADHVPGSTAAKSVAPAISFAKLDPADVTRRTIQDAPRVLGTAVVGWNDRLADLFLTVPTTPTPVDHVTAFLRPTSICVPDATDLEGETFVVTPHETDVSGLPIVADPAATTNDVAALLHRNATKTSLVYGCLPPGEYALTATYETGQSWTLPNELGVCVPPNELPTTDGNGRGRCGARLVSPSQSFVLEVGPATDPAACNGKRDSRIRAACLTESERAAWDAGTLWNRR
ncbi:MAG: hypothetical protein U0169_13605 [Polyangiaceae bacterium]